MSDELQAALDEVLADREPSLGDATVGHRNLGLIWTALLQDHYGIVLDHPLPPELVLLMMAGCKLNRAAIKFKFDHYLDLLGYTKLAYAAAEKPEEEPCKSDPT